MSNLCGRVIIFYLRRLSVLKALQGVFGLFAKVIKKAQKKQEWREKKERKRPRVKAVFFVWRCPISEVKDNA
jgi:hypothetical protein